MTFNGEEDEDTFLEEGPQIERCGGEDTLVEEGPQIERGTVFLRDTCHSEISKETFVTSGTRLKRGLIWAMSKWRKTL